MSDGFQGEGEKKRLGWGTQGASRVVGIFWLLNWFHDGLYGVCFIIILSQFYKYYFVVKCLLKQKNE